MYGCRILIWIESARRNNNNNKFCSNLVKSTLRVPVTRLGWKTVHCSRLDFGYIIASRKLSICEVQNPTYSVTYSENLIPVLIPVSTSAQCFDVSSMWHQLNVSTSVQCDVIKNYISASLEPSTGSACYISTSRHDVKNVQKTVLCHPRSWKNVLCHRSQFVKIASCVSFLLC